jgi:hypothetical protein
MVAESVTKLTLQRTALSIESTRNDACMGRVVSASDKTQAHCNRSTTGDNVNLDLAIDSI